MIANISAINATLVQLCQEAEAVSFYDAWAVLRAMRHVADVPNSIVTNLVALFDAPQATDGAKELLAGFIRSTIAKVQAQKALAERPIRLKDAGKIARAHPGITLVLQLDERRASGLFWEVTDSRGPIRCSRRLDASDAPSCFFDVALDGVGLARVEATGSATLRARGIAQQSPQGRGI